MKETRKKSILETTAVLLFFFDCCVLLFLLCFGFDMPSATLWNNFLRPLFIIIFISFLIFTIVRFIVKKL